MTNPLDLDRIEAYCEGFNAACKRGDYIPNVDTFATEARTDLPACVAEIRRLRTELERLRESELTEEERRRVLCEVQIWSIGDTALDYKQRSERCEMMNSIRRKLERKRNAGTEATDAE